MDVPKFVFGDIVIVNQDEIGLVLRSWANELRGKKYCVIYNNTEEDTEEWDEDLVERYDVLKHSKINY